MSVLISHEQQCLAVRHVIAKVVVLGTDLKSICVAYLKGVLTLQSYNKSQQDALFLKVILIKKSTCFGQIYRSVLK